MAKKTETAPPANLPCAECGYANEAERVYCHSCGAKLDRSLLPKPDEKDGKTETPEQARKRIATIANPKSGGAGREIKMAASVLIYSAILAALILVARKPDGVPEVSKEMPARSVGDEMMDARDAVEPRRLDFTEAEINAYLRKLKSEDGTVLRTYVNLNPGVLHFGAEKSVFGLPLYSGVLYRLEVKDGKFTPTMLGGNFGRLQVHPLAMQYLDFFFQKLWTALSHERQQMDQMRAVVVRKGTITLVTKGRAQ